MIAILDYGMGNVGSIANMLKKINAKAIITADHEVIKSADKLILPGVGSFDRGMIRLAESGFKDLIIDEVVNKKKPILGICLGMQLLTNRSDEGVEKGLGFIDAETIHFNKLKENFKQKIPHMGWNLVRVEQESKIVEDIPDPSKFYFVHTYFVKCKYQENVLMSTQYGDWFTSAIIKDNIIGMQFHPEKSHKFGMSVLRNFAKI